MTITLNEIVHVKYSIGDLIRGNYPMNVKLLYNPGGIDTFFFKWGNFANGTVFYHSGNM